MFARTDTISVQRHQREMVNMAGILLHTERHVVGRALECAPLELGIWVRMSGAQRCERAGDSNGLRRVCALNQRFEVGGRAETLGRHPLDPQPSMCLAGSVAVRGSWVHHFLFPIASSDCAQAHDSGMFSTWNPLSGVSLRQNPKKRCTFWPQCP